MRESQRIVDRIRMILRLPSVELTEELRQLALSFAAVSQRTYERLRNCLVLARDGQRTEAVRQAELEPRVMETLGDLDFPERPQWDQVCEFGNLAQAVMFDPREIETLNQLYLLERPLESGLRRHRLMALTRAPLPQRIAVLRELIQLDPLSVGWREDLETFEQARHRELLHDAERALANQDHPRLQQLYAEVMSPQWMYRPPEVIVQRMTAAMTRVQAEEMLHGLRQLAADLNRAYLDCNEMQGRNLRAAWENTASQLPIPLPPELAAEVMPALQWLAGCDDHARLTAEQIGLIEIVEARLRQNSPEASVAQAYADLRRHPVPIPGELAMRVERYFKEQAKAKTRRRLLLGTIAVLVVGGIVGGTAIWVTNAAHERAVLTARGELQKLEKDQNDEVAAKYLEELKADQPAVFEATALREVRLRTETMIATRRKRREEFDGALRRMRDAGTFAEMSSAADAAAGLASGEAEKAELSSATKSAQGRLEGMLQEQRTELNAKFAAVAADLTALPADPEPDPLKVLVMLEAIRKRVTDLKPEADRLRLSEGYQGLERQLAAVRGPLERAKQDAEAENSLSGFAAEPQAFADALRKAAGNHSLGPDLLQASTEHEGWKLLGAWTEPLSKWNAEGDAVGPAEAAARVALVKPLLAAPTQFPWKFAVSRKQAVWEAVSARIPQAGTSKAAGLKAIFSNQYLAKVHLLTMSTSVRLYLLEPLDPEKEKQVGDTILLKYLVNLAGKTGSKRWPRDQLLRCDVAPQSALCRKLETATADLANAAKVGTWPASELIWEEFIGDCIREIGESEDLDPIAKGLFLRQVLELGLPGSVALQKIWGKTLDELRKPPTEFPQNWVDPDDKPSQDARPRIKAWLTGLADWKADKLEECRETYRPLPYGPARPVGWLTKDRQGQWQFRQARAPEAEGELGTVVKVGTVWTWEAVGKVVGGKASLHRPPVGKPVVGRPVFFRAEPVR